MPRAASDCSPSSWIHDAVAVGPGGGDDLHRCPGLRAFRIMGAILVLLGRRKKPLIGYDR